MRKTKTLLGISLFGVLLLSLGVILTKSRITQAQQSFTRTNIMYTGIDSNAETLYALRFQDLTTMEIFNNNIFRTSEVPVIVNGVNLSNQSEIDTSRNTINSSNNSNILGGDLLKIEGSDDITVIGGEGNPEEISVHPNNSYATFLGGLANKLFENGEIQVPVVLLGGEKNIMRPNHNASVIVGGVDNQIHDNAKNVSILGGENDTVEGDRSNIIIGGENVRIHEVDDVFVFSDGSDGEFSPNMGGAFYLNVQNGVGFGTGASGSGGVVSNGAVSLGGNIDDIECNEENIGIQGKWNGCLVGCTQAAASVTDWDTWELLDHGPSCADKCESSNKCMQLEEKEPEEIESYTSFCTQGLVFTGNASMCNTGGVDDYENVVFETYLIDSTATCPSDDDYYNQCAYKCDPDTHLTGDDTGKFNKITMCFHDCRLPWDDEGTLERKKHNETIFAYDATDAYCSNDAGVKDHCGTHKKELICVDGRWYTTNNSHKAAAVNTKYVYETCTLNRYEGCDGTGYDLTRREIINEKEDFMPFWKYGSGNPHFRDYLGYLNGAAYVSYQYVDNLYDQFHGWALDDPKQADRSQQQGVRGVYKLCIDYVPDTSTGDPTNVDPDNAKTCREKDPLPKQYHYKFIRCRNDPNNVYDEDSFGVCRKRCTFGTKTIKHTETISLYTGSSATCTDICHAEIFRCYDGTLYQDSTLQIDAKGKLISGVPHHNASMSIYNQLNCTLNGVTCPGYSTTQSTYNANQNSGYYTSCQKYSASGKFNCTAGDMMYQLQWCNADHYQNSDACPSCPAGYHTSGTGATAKSQCVINCPAGKHVATADQQCVSCPTGTQSSAHSVNGGSTSNCTTCNNKPANSHYVGASTNSDCTWACDAGYYKNGNVCSPCPTGTWSADGSEGASSCNMCTNAPDHSTYTDKGTYNNCPWACNIGYYPSTEEITRYILDDPDLGTLPMSVFGQCSMNAGDLVCKQEVAGLAGIGNLVPRSIQVDICAECTNKPLHSVYTSNGTDNNCSFDCDAGYYKDYGELIFDRGDCDGGMCKVTGIRDVSNGGTVQILQGNALLTKLNARGGCSNGYCPLPPATCTQCPEGYTSDQGAVGADACYEEAKCSSISYLPDCGTNQSCPSIPDSDLCDVGTATITQIGGTYCNNGSCHLYNRTYTCTNYNSVVSCSKRLPAQCVAPDGTYVGHKEERTFYNNLSPVCPQTCQSQSRVCNDGDWYTISTIPHMTHCLLGSPCYTDYGASNRGSLINFTSGYDKSGTCTLQGQNTDYTYTSESACKAGGHSCQSATVYPLNGDICGSPHTGWKRTGCQSPYVESNGYCFLIGKCYNAQCKQCNGDQFAVESISGKPKEWYCYSKKDISNVMNNYDHAGKSHCRCN